MWYYITKKKGQNEQNWCSNDVRPSKQTVYHSKECKAVDNTVLTTLEVTTYRWLSKPYHTLECIFFLSSLHCYFILVCIQYMCNCYYYALRNTSRANINVYKYIFFVFLHACKHVVMLLLLLLLCYNQKDSGNILLYYSCLWIKEKYHSNYHWTECFFIYLCHFFKHFFSRVE